MGKGSIVFIIPKAIFPVGTNSACGSIVEQIQCIWSSVRWLTNQEQLPVTQLPLSTSYGGNHHTPLFTHHHRPTISSQTPTKYKCVQIAWGCLQAAWKQILTIGRRMHRQSGYLALPRRRAVSHSRLHWWEQSHPGMNERDACRNPPSHPAWESEEKRKMQIHEDNPYHNNQAENGIRAQIMCIFTISSYFIIFPLLCNTDMNISHFTRKAQWTTTKLCK